MKSNSKTFSTGFICFSLVALVWVGCNQKTPTASSVAASATDPYAILNITNSSYSVGTNLIGNPASNFENIVSWSVPVTFCSGPAQLVPAGFPFYNPGGVPTGDSYGAGLTCQPIATVGYNHSFFQTGLTDGYDQYGINIYGFVNDPENPLYPPGAGNQDSLTLEVFPNGTGGLYDVSPYQGIQFFIYVGSTDSAVDRVFLANVQQQVPGSQGTCIGGPPSPDPFLTHCFDGFEYDYTNTAKNQWVLVQKSWGDLKQYGYGSITSPPTFTGTNLQQLAYFQWVESNASSSGPMTINFSIAGVRFF